VNVDDVVHHLAQALERIIETVAARGLIVEAEVVALALVDEAAGGVGGVGEGVVVHLDGDRDAKLAAAGGCVTGLDDRGVPELAVGGGGRDVGGPDADDGRAEGVGGLESLEEVDAILHLTRRAEAEVGAEGDDLKVALLAEALALARAIVIVDLADVGLATPNFDAGEAQLGSGDEGVLEEFLTKR
jgi:hypothetical protein